MSLIADTLSHMNTPTKATLAVGYALAVPGLLGIYAALRNPAGRVPVVNIPSRVVIIGELLGAGCVTTGWFVAGYRANNAVNVLWILACTTFWIRAENKLRLQKKNAD